MRQLLRLTVLALCALLLWRAVDWSEAAHLLRAADPRWLAGALVLLTLQTVLSAERWRITAAQLGITFPFRHALREYYLSQVVNQSLPGGILGDAGRAVRAREQAGLLASGQTVLFERIAGQIGLVAMLLIGLAIGLAAPGLHDWPGWFRTLGATFLGICAGVCLLVFVLVRRFAPVRRAVSRATGAFWHAVAGRAVRHRQVVLSLATALCNVAAFALCAAAIGAPLTLLSAITLIPLVLFAMVLPLSIGGWGLREGAAVALFPLFGATAGEGLAASVAFGLTILVSVLPGFVLGWTARKG
ncbi:MAG: lysylphosphatidylglycerol synthase transmembrane domain-containing protein, partial [Pseudomonadota bacterium]